MSIRRGVVAAVALQQIDCAPNTQTTAQSDDHSLHNVHCTVKKFHSKISFVFEKHDPARTLKSIRDLP